MTVGVRTSRGLAALITVAVVLAGCGTGTQAVEEAAQIASPVLGTAAAKASPKPGDGTPGRPGTASGPGASGGAGGHGGTATDGNIDCDDQPKTFSPMSPETIKWMRHHVSGFRIKVVDPATVAGIASPKQAAAKPWDRCENGGGKLLSWELALGRVTMDLPCKSVPGGACRKLVVNKLLYVERREFFGPGNMPLGPPRPKEEREAEYERRMTFRHTVSCWYEDAETGRAGDNGRGGDC